MITHKRIYIDKKVTNWTCFDVLSKITNNMRNCMQPVSEKMLALHSNLTSLPWLPFAKRGGGRGTISPPIYLPVNHV